jgi:hypothetical protein
MACGTPTANPGINQHSSLDRLIPTSQKKLNNKQGTEKDMQQRVWDAVSEPEKGGRARSCTPRELLVNKACNNSWQASPSTGEGKREQ